MCSRASSQTSTSTSDRPRTPSPARYKIASHYPCRAAYTYVSGRGPKARDGQRQRDRWVSDWAWAGPTGAADNRMIGKLSLNVAGQWDAVVTCVYIVSIRIINDVQR